MAKPKTHMLVRRSIWDPRMSKYKGWRQQAFCGSGSNKLTKKRELVDCGNCNRMMGHGTVHGI